VADDRLAGERFQQTEHRLTHLIDEFVNNEGVKTSGN
jgi:hypothetical protein